MATQKQYDLEEIALALEHFQNQPKVETVPSMADKLLAHAPAWLTILGVAIASYIILNGRMTTVEYQNQVSMTDRVALHTKLDEATHDMSEVKSNFAAMKADLTDIKEAVHDLVSKRR